MTIRKWPAGALILMLTATGLTIGQAQPDPNNAAKGDNPPAAAPGPDWAKMTPEQRKEAQVQMLKGIVVQGLNFAGFTDAKLQGTILDFMVAREKADQPVRDRAIKVAEALLAKDTSDKDMAILLADFRAEVDTARHRRKDQAAALDLAIGFSKNPKLDAFLSMMGLVGDESNFVGGESGSLAGVMTVIAPAVQGDLPK